jgi:hypothetical protein
MSTIVCDAGPRFAFLGSTGGGEGEGEIERSCTSKGTFFTRRVAAGASMGRFCGSAAGGALRLRGTSACSRPTDGAVGQLISDLVRYISPLIASAGIEHKAAREHRSLNSNQCTPDLG